MDAYASRTGTRRNLDALRAAGWGLLVSAEGVHRTEGFERVCLDNGIWTVFQVALRAEAKARGIDPRDMPAEDAAAIARSCSSSWNPAKFEALVGAFGAVAEFVVLPDIICGGAESLARSMEWSQWVLDRAPVGLLAVQDGMEPGDVRALLGPRLGIFVGGSTDWKLRTLPAWAALARDLGVRCHVGRVNSAKRIALCAYYGATSFDGSNASRYAALGLSRRGVLPGLEAARRQHVLDTGAAHDVVTFKAAAPARPRAALDPSDQLGLGLKETP